MRDFFVYCATTFDSETDVISIRKRRVRKEDKGWEEDGDRDHNYICIEVSPICLSRRRSQRVLK